MPVQDPTAGWQFYENSDTLPPSGAGPVLRFLLSSLSPDFLSSICYPQSFFLKKLLPQEPAYNEQKPVLGGMSPLLAPGRCSMQQNTRLWLLHGACRASLTQNVHHLVGETLLPSEPSATPGEGRTVH